VTLSKLSAIAALFWLGAALPAVASDLAAPGVPNFHNVDNHVYRGGQPNAEGWKTLAGLGVKTVIDLRPDGDVGGHSTRAEAQAVEAAGMRYVSIPLNGMRAPSEAEMTKILTAFNSKEPVFVHCRLGKDRTGTAVACYRIAHDQWPNAKALEEARQIGIHWFEVSMKRYIMGYHAGATQTAGGGLTPTPALVTAHP
jgi:tyrosine-protein phosphatase SIW14